MDSGTISVISLVLTGVIMGVLYPYTKKLSKWLQERFKDG